MNWSRSQAGHLATLSTQVIIWQEHFKVKTGTLFVILVLENHLGGSFIIVSRQMSASSFLISRKLYRVDMLATKHSMCHCLYYRVCNYARDADEHYHLCHHWPCNLTSPIPFLRVTLDHNLSTRDLWITKKNIDSYHEKHKSY